MVGSGNTRDVVDNNKDVDYASQYYNRWEGQLKMTEKGERRGKWEELETVNC